MMIPAKGDCGTLSHAMSSVGCRGEDTALIGAGGNISSTF